MGDPVGVATGLGRLAALYAASDRLGAAEDALRRARERATGPACDAVEVHAGHLDLARGRPEEAWARLEYAREPTAGGPGPSPAAWSSDVRFAVRLLDGVLRRAP